MGCLSVCEQHQLKVSDKFYGEWALIGQETE